MLIDVHCHIMPPEIADNTGKFAKLDPYFALLCKTKGARFATGEDLFRTMERQKVDKAVIFGFGFKDLGVSRLQNDYVMALCRDNPGKLAWLGVLDPQCPGAMAEAERCLSLGAAGFGELFPAGHGFSMEGEAMDRLSGMVHKAGAFLLIHVNEQVGHYYPGKTGQGSREAYAFAVRNPETKVVFAHFGGGLAFYGAMPEIRRLPNLYYDTAAQPLLYGPSVYQVIKAAGTLDKLLFASDYPLLSCRRYLADLEKSGLSAQEIEAVSSGNALEFLGDLF